MFFESIFQLKVIRFSEFPEGNQKNNIAQRIKLRKQAIQLDLIKGVIFMIEPF